MLSKAEKDYIIELLDKGETIPEDFKHKLFPIQHKEYELAVPITKSVEVPKLRRFHQT